MSKLARAALMSALLSSGFVHLQANERARTPEQRQEIVDKKLQKLTKRLKLTSDQQNQVRNIILDKMDKQQQAMDEANTKIHALLTPIQMSKYRDFTD